MQQRCTGDTERQGGSIKLSARSRRGRVVLEHSSVAPFHHRHISESQTGPRFSRLTWLLDVTEDVRFEKEQGTLSSAEHPRLSSWMVPGGVS
jgi:hypothetical protein